MIWISGWRKDEECPALAEVTGVVGPRGQEGVASEDGWVVLQEPWRVEASVVDTLFWVAPDTVCGSLRYCAAYLSLYGDKMFYSKQRITNNMKKFC